MDWLDHRVCSSVRGFVWLKEKQRKKKGPGPEEGREVCGGGKRKDSSTGFNPAGPHDWNLSVLSFQMGL